jgi:hypothetical protein
MDVEQIENALYAIAKVKIPPELRIGEEPDAVDVARGDNERRPLPPHKKIELLEDYLLLTAEKRQEATEARLYMQASLKVLRDRWRDLPEWQKHLNGTPVEKATGPQIDRAKRCVDADLADSIEKAEWLERRLGEQIKRLQHDDDVASRVYTLITGG